MNKTRVPAALIWVAAVAACEPYVDTFTLGMDASADAGTTIAPDAAEPIEEDAGGYQLELVPADILFVVDNSGSMFAEQENLAVNFARFIDQIAGVGDYRIAVISTDFSTPDGERTGKAYLSYGANTPWQLEGIDIHECGPAGIAHGCFRGPDPTKRVIDSTMSRDEQIQTFRDNVRIGTCGTGVEQGIDAMLSALDQTAPGACNEGFLRSAANLIIIFVSDEDDESLTSLDEAVTRLGALKPYSNLRMATIVGAVDGVASSCGASAGAQCGSLCTTPPPSGSQTMCMIGSPAACPAGEFCLRDPMGGTAGVCENTALRYWSAETCASCSFYDAPDCCAASPGTKYIELARRLELQVSAHAPLFPVAQCRGMGTRVACLADSICQENFGDTLARIARELVLVSTGN